MGKVHRNGLPPKRFQHKTVLTFSDFEWNEDKLLRWLRDMCVGNSQYDFIIFQGPERLSKRTVEATIWFEKKKDAMLFKLSWAA